MTGSACDSLSRVLTRAGSRRGVLGLLAFRDTPGRFPRNRGRRTGWDRSCRPTAPKPACHQPRTRTRLGHAPDLRRGVPYLTVRLTLR